MNGTPSCAGCGMAVKPLEYHPYAACLMFKACRNADQVRVNLGAVIDYARHQAEVNRRRRIDG